MSDVRFTFDGVEVHSPLGGVFNVYNALGAATAAARTPRPRSPAGGPSRRG